jgi:4-amino-4-deoxy-L-arabinose transferase-like glycosyltransferase
MKREIVVYCLAAALLATHFLIAIGSIRLKTATYDEVAHVAAGYCYWTGNDSKCELQYLDGRLPQCWISLPLLGMGLEFPALQWHEKIWKVGRDFFFGCGNDADAMLWRARLMNAILSVGFGVLIFAWSRKLFGSTGGIISLSLYALSPTILAHCRLATADLAASAFFLLSAGSLWRMFHRISVGTVVCCWLALTGLVLSKTSAVLIVPICLLMLMVRLIGRCNLLLAWRRESVVADKRLQAGILAGALLLQAGLVVGSIWTFHGFRYSVRASDENTEIMWNNLDAKLGSFSGVMKFARDYRLLPESYLNQTAHLITMVRGTSDFRKFPSFLNGNYYQGGVWYFFPYTFLVKTPLMLFLLLLLAAIAAIWEMRHKIGGRVNENTTTDLWKGFYRTTPLWILFAVYWASSLLSQLNIGHRHLLPIYPILFILAGGAASWFHQRNRLGIVLRYAVVLCLVALAVDCFRTFPHYLAYFNTLAGGPSNGYKHLCDSSLDWGQDLPGLRRWLDHHKRLGVEDGPVYLGYFGVADPVYYQISATDLDSPKPLGAGTYCISATYLQQLYNDFPGGWTANHERKYQKAFLKMRQLSEADEATQRQLIESKGVDAWNEVYHEFYMLRAGRICAYLRDRNPDDNIGYSILIYRLTESDIAAQLAIRH